MEDSFKVRIYKVFGSLASNLERPESLWTLTDEEIEIDRKERDRGKKATPDPEDQHGLVSSSRRGVFEEEEEDDDDAVKPSSRLAAKPDDHDEEEWLIRTSVGMDTTLDKEEEEDEYDQIAVGIDKIDQCEDAFEDEEVVGEIESFVASDEDGAMIPIGEISDRMANKRVGVKSSLKKDEKNGQRKSLKRVRFDAESGSDLEVEENSVDRSVKLASRSELEGRVSFPPPGTDPRVPDYLRNPDKYTQYTLDSDIELNDEDANRKAYLDFFNLIREKHAKESQSAEDMSDYTKPLTFMPRKKTVDDDSMEISDPVKRGGHKENIQSKVASSVVIAAADDASAMEEDETEITSVCIPRKAQRQYRAKATLEPLDD